jgi:hypothetical protein
MNGDIIGFDGRPDPEKLLAAAKACFPEHDPFQPVLDLLANIAARVEAAGYAEADVVQGLVDRASASIRRLADRLARESLGRMVAHGIGVAAMLMAATGVASLWIGYEQGVRFASLDAQMTTCQRGTVQMDAKTSRRVGVLVVYLDPPNMTDQTFAFAAVLRSARRRSPLPSGEGREAVRKGEGRAAAII